MTQRQQWTRAVASGDKTALQTAYARLTNAQNTLSEAEAELIRTKDAQSAENQKALEDRIDNLEKQIKDLTADLAKAKVVDISHYQTSMKTSFTYTGKAIKPSVKVSGLAASVYKVSYSGNTKVGTAKVTIKASNSRYKGTITRTFRILPRKAAIAKVKAGKKKNDGQGENKGWQNRRNQVPDPVPDQG